MIRVLVPGALLAALVATGAAAAPAPPAPAALSWFITPGDDTCRTDVELVGRSGASVPAVLESNGQKLVLRFAKEDVPERAFLPIRIDQKPYSNLVLRGQPAGMGELVLSETTQAALRKGATLQIAWLSNEPVSAPLAGSEQGIPDLHTCGAQVFAQHRARLAAEQEASARAEADARGRQLAEAQIEAARAQQAAADAERQRLANAEAQRRWAEQDAERQRAFQQAERERMYQPPMRPRYEEPDDGYWAPRPPPPVWGYRPY